MTKSVNELNGDKSKTAKIIKDDITQQHIDI